MKDLVDDRLILDTGDYLGFTSALLADRHVNVEHTLQALRPTYRLVPLLRSLIITLMRLGTFATFAGRYIDTVFAAGYEHAKPGQVHPGLGMRRNGQLKATRCS
jgi:hypothetical protein